MSLVVSRVGDVKSVIGKSRDWSSRRNRFGTGHRNHLSVGKSSKIVVALSAILEDSLKSFLPSMG